MATECVLRAVGAAMGLHSPPDRWRTVTLSAVSKAADEFEKAIEPGSVGALRAKPAELEARVQAYLARNSLSDKAIRDNLVLENAQAIFDASAPPPEEAPVGETVGEREEREERERKAQAKEAHLRGRFEGLIRGAPERFLSYDDGKLTKVVEYFRKWDGHVGYLSGLRPRNLRKEAWLVEFRRETVEYLARALGVLKDGAEEAFQDAMLDEIAAMNESRDDPQAARYVYEGALDGWLKNAAYNRCRAMRNVNWRQAAGAPAGAGVIPAGWRGLDLPDPEDMLDAYELVLSTFDKPAGVAAAWAEILEYVFGIPAPPTARRPTALEKHNLLSRLLAVLYVRENQTDTDRDLIGYLLAHHHFQPNQQGTLLKLAALARAAQGESLLWAAAANYLVGKNLTIDQVLQVLPGLRRLPGACDRVLAARIYTFGDRATRWNQLPGGRRGRFVAACWYLENWRSKWEVESAGRCVLAANDPAFAEAYHSVEAPLVRALKRRPAVLAAATLHLLENGGNVRLTQVEYPDLRDGFLERCQTYDFETRTPLWQWPNRSGEDRERLAAAWLRKNCFHETLPPEGNWNDVWSEV
jgi:hypothetical protein